MELRWLTSLALVALAGCASMPSGRYGVSHFELTGMQALAPEALEMCLATRERADWTFRLGLSAPSCGQPPFDDTAPKLELWSWPWTSWPLFDPAIFMVDKERILRWFQARGHYDARILHVSLLAGGEEVKGAQCKAEDSSRCELDVTVEVDEGAPVMVTDVQLSAADAPEALTSTLRAALSLHPGERFDEFAYERDKAVLERELIEASYAVAKVDGRVVIARGERTARIEYTIDTGPKCVFGQLRLRGAEGLPTTVLLETAAIPQGEPYRQETVEDAQRELFALGLFSAVRIEKDVHGRVVDLSAEVQQARVARWQAGFGVLSGSLTRVTSDETFSVPQWDVHMSASYDNKNFLGGLRQLHIEDRPALIFLDNFPRVPQSGPRVGNVLSAKLVQPGFVEARTRLIATAAWDLGPDPFRGFFRHDLAIKLGLERAFFRQALTVRAAVQHDFYEILQLRSAPSDVTDYKLPFLEQQVVVDIRDNPGRPRIGAFFGFTVQEAFRLGSYGSWDYVRLMPDVRGYIPLFWDVVLAARFMVGALLVSSAAPELPASAALLGPQTYRLRGGGANGNRGFLAGRLGDGIEGGSRRWEASLELRVPLSENLGAVVFADAGDVHRETSFRFTHLNAATGLGLRYYSPLGAIRLDAGWRLPGLQRLRDQTNVVTLGPVPSAVHLTIGEAF